MLKFGTPTIALPLAIKKCTVQTGCTVYIMCMCLGRCKSWTLDSGLDRGLDHGLDHGLDRGLEYGLKHGPNLIKRVATA